MSRPAVGLLLLAALTLVASLYCFSGYAMNASLSVHGDHELHSRMAVRWGIAGIVFIAIAFASVIAAWRHHKRM